MKRITLLILAISAALLASCGQKPQQTSSDIPLYLDLNANIEDRIDDALSRMTLEE